jgi:hypothetical protein
MARQPVLNEDALGKLGLEKLVRLVLDEAKRNAAFRKLVSAALAATKGPAAVAAIIDKRLAGLERAKSFLDWDKAKELASDLSATAATISGELASVDPDAAVNRLVRFLATADRVFERVDDSSGRLQEVYCEAAAALPDLVGRLDGARKASIPDRLFDLTLSDDYGLLDPVIPAIVAQLPAEAIAHWDERLARMQSSLRLTDDSTRDWQRRAKFDGVIRLRQAIADCRQDVDAFVVLETSRHHGHHDTLAIAERLYGAGRYGEALDWVRKQARRSLKFITRDDLADGSDPRDLSDLARAQLEIRILDAMGDRDASQDLRWTTFESTLDARLLRDHIRHLPDFSEFDVLDKGFAHAMSSPQKYRALAFFLSWPRLDLAAKLVLDRREDWEGRHYEVLLPAAEALEPDHPVAATILYRVLLDDILDRARSPAYGHAARYLQKLDVLAVVECASPVEAHQSYRAALLKKHGRKTGFWSLVDAQKPKRIRAS